MGKDRQPDHVLKTRAPFFEQVKRGDKTFEVRKDDRGFQVGDLLLLREWDHHDERFTGRGVGVEVAYKLDGGEFGVEAGYCVLGIELR